MITIDRRAHTKSHIGRTLHSRLLRVVCTLCCACGMRRRTHRALCTVVAMGACTSFTGAH